MTEPIVRAAVPGALAFVGVASLSAFDGGFFPVEWGWSALGFLVAIGTAICLLERVELGRLDGALILGLGALAAWGAASALWSDSVPRSLDETLRSILYACAAAAFVLTATRESPRWVMRGIWAAASAVTIHALADHWLDGSEEGRLSGLLGYWNALALLAAMGAVLGVGLALDERQTAVRGAALASLPGFGLALALTESRGGWIALAAGLVALAALRARVPSVPRSLIVGGGVVVLAGSAVLLLAVGGAGHVSDAFRGASPAGGGLDERILSVSGSGRDEYWRVAWQQYAANPVLGSGGGTYELYWNRERNTIYGARDAHNLYLETLAELGPLGLALLGLTLVVPLVAAWRRREDRYLAGAAGAYVAYVVHAALDWDWELPALTIAALACGSALVVAARPSRRYALTRGRRGCSLALVTALVVLVSVAHVGNGALRDSERALDRGNVDGAAAAARRAIRWAPWSSAPGRALAQAELVAGDKVGARAALTEPLQRDPLDSSLWILLAEASEGEERKRAIAQAARLNPLSVEVRALLAGR